MTYFRLYFVVSIVSLLFLFTGVSLNEENIESDFLHLTVATQKTDGFKRLIRSTNINGIPVKVLGMGKEWRGGDMMKTGGGYKIFLLKEALEQYKDDDKKIIMFTDGYDVIVTGSLSDIKHRFINMDAGIVFGSEPNCWPDQSLADKYPVTESKYKYLNSGGFIGYASNIYNFITELDLESNTTDDQLFYTKLFLNQQLREKYRVTLDYKSNIFQNLYDALDDIEMRFDGELTYLENIKYSTIPLVIHGNGRAKDDLNTISNYIPNAWTQANGCVACLEDQLNISEKEEDLPKVFIGIFITHPTPFLEEFFRRIVALQYPKNKLYLFIYNSVPYHETIVNNFVVSYSKEYILIKQLKQSDAKNEAEARTIALKKFLSNDYEYFFTLDGIAHLDNPLTLQSLMRSNKSVVAPILIRPFRAWSNFWGALTKEGFYSRSLDYMNIVNFERRGLWNVPYISSAYLIKGSLIKTIKPKFYNDKLDPDMAFCKHYRDRGIFMYVDNTVEYGHLVDPENYDTSLLNPEMYQLFNNKFDWERRYIHPDYYETLNPNNTVKMPCPDVYWFPIVSESYCKELIEIMENFGKWSDGSNEDNRLVGGYENVPTRDIHMNQVGLEPTWLEFLRVYVRPLQEKLFIGYYHDPPRSLMNFVVRYKPDEQPNLRPHHDSSTYTVNLALNKPNIDYQGGGCKFLRYNCSVIDTKIGWMLMHPGRLTHYHEGLKVTGGIRYIMISFVDP